MYSANTQAYGAYNFYADALLDPLPLVVSPDFQSRNPRIAKAQSQNPGIGKWSQDWKHYAWLTSSVTVLWFTVRTFVEIKILHQNHLQASSYHHQQVLTDYQPLNTKYVHHACTILRQQSNRWHFNTQRCISIVYTLRTFRNINYKFECIQNKANCMFQITRQIE